MDTSAILVYKSVTPMLVTELVFFCILVRQIVKHINRHNNLEARVDRMEERSRQVCVTDDTTCGRCRARIGTKLFVLFPDDSIVCYKVLRLTVDTIFPETVVLAN